MAGMARDRAWTERDLSAVPQPQGDTRPHVALEVAGNLRIHHDARALHQLLDDGIVRLVVLKGVEVYLAIAESRRRRELPRELGLQTALGARVDENTRHRLIDAD